MRFLASSFLLALLSGCAFHPPEDPGKTPPEPINDSPQGAVLRFKYVYEQQALPLYELLLTSDFRYTFSIAADPRLVNQYPNWGRDDEVESTKHLFEGFTNSQGVDVARASRITLDLAGVQYGTDTTHPDSAGWYQKVVVTAVDMVIEAGDVTYQVSGRHELYLVRGDAAVLDDGQEPRVDRWYLRRWDDLSTPTAAPEPVPSFSWGELKAARN